MMTHMLAVDNQQMLIAISGTPYEAHAVLVSNLDNLNFLNVRALADRSSDAIASPVLANSLSYDTLR